MGEGSKTLNLKSEQKNRLLRSIAQYFERCELPKCFKELLSEAEIEENTLNTSSLPDLSEVLEHKVLLRSIAQYLERSGLSKCFKELLSEAEIEKTELNTILPDLEELFLRKENKAKSSEAESLGDDGKEKVSKKRKPKESKELTVDDEESKRRKKGKNVVQDDKGVQVSKEGNEEIMHAFKKITTLLKTLQEQLITTSGLEKLHAKAVIMPDSKLADLLSSCNWTEVLYSWRTKEPDLIPEPYKQTLDDCWSVALSRGQTVLVALGGIPRPLLTYSMLKEGVCRSHQNDARGLERLEHARSFMVGRYVDKMTIHSRPMEDYQDFEILIERLLTKGPVVVSYDLLPTYSSYEGKGVYIPTDLECQARTYEEFEGHTVVLSGCGIQLVDGEIIEFWEYQDSQGADWGEMGFGRLARRKGLITKVVELKV